MTHSSEFFYSINISYKRKEKIEMKMKLISNKKIIAIFTTATLINTPLTVNPKTNITPYYENGYFNIHQNNLYTLSITKKELETLLDDETDISIEIKVGNELTNIDKTELLELKEIADNEEKKERELCALIASLGGLAGSTVLIKDKIKTEIKKKE